MMENGVVMINKNEMTKAQNIRTLTEFVANEVIGMKLSDAIKLINEKQLYYVLPNQVITCDFRLDRILLGIDESNNTVKSTRIG